MIILISHKIKKRNDPILSTTTEIQHYLSIPITLETGVGLVIKITSLRSHYICKLMDNYLYIRPKSYPCQNISLTGLGTRYRLQIQEKNSQLASLSCIFI